MDKVTKKSSGEGLQLNSKTVIGITAVLLCVWILCGVLTHVIPRGEYTTFINESTGKPSVTAESEYHAIDDYKMPVWKIIAAPVMVFADSETRETGMTGLLIIAFIVIMGGTFLLLDRAGILKYVVALAMKKFSKKKYLLMAILIFFFMMLSSTAGTLEESVTFVPICAAVSLVLGWDSLVGIGMSLVAVMFGFTAATFNPFNVLTVQKLAGDVAIYSGLWLRLLTFALVYITLFGFLAVYAKRIEKDPTKSICYESDAALREHYKIDNVEEVLTNTPCKKGAMAFGICLLLAFVCIILDFVLGTSGVLSMGGIALFFTVGGISASGVAGMKAKDMGKGFLSGIRTVVPILPLIFMVISVAYILNTGKIMHTILYYVYNLLNGLHPAGAILLIFVFVALLEFFIGSGTAKAFLIMPLVIPLAHLIGLSSNSVTLAFCLADGFTNMLYPTSGVMIIAIGLIGVTYTKWLKFTWPLFILEGIVSVGVMLLAVAVGYA